jgi:hypothetical protein
MSTCAKNNDVEIVGLNHSGGKRAVFIQYDETPSPYQLIRRVFIGAPGSRLKMLNARRQNGRHSHPCQMSREIVAGPDADRLSSSKVAGARYPT